MNPQSADAARFDRLNDLFARACDLDEQQRRALLDSQCADDPDLRRQLDALLRADNGPARIFDSSILGGELGRAVQRAAQFEDVGLALPAQIGRYTLTRVLGRGGMGTVYEGEQDSPRRAVAVKLLRPGMMSPQVMRRFLHEAEILGTLHHAGVAQVYESGSAEMMTAGGPVSAPFIAMELIRGSELLAHVHGAGMDVRERLTLFIRICEAVQHAHLKGVIHRDLKPGNILVDRSGHPKIVDFGVARHEAQARTMMTIPGQMLGTLAYMSPEQVAGDAALVDARSDVYALGVVLYELLADRLPLDVRSGSIVEAACAIRDDDPPTLKEIVPGLHSDLSTITAKALAKRPQDRYQSAEELAADLRRHLGHEPILARRATTAYVLRKLVRRYRAITAAAVAGFAALVLGAVAATVFAVRADQARKVAEASEVSAAREAARSAYVARFMQGMLAGVRPAVAAGRDRTMLRDLLDQTEARIDAGELDDQPQVEAEIRATIGSVYRDLGELDRAARVLERAVEALARSEGPSPLLRSTVHAHLGGVRQEQGRLIEAQRHLDLAASALPDPAARGFDEIDHGWKIVAEQAALRRRADDPFEAERLYREVLAWTLERKGPHDEEVARQLQNLAGVLADQSRFAEAEARLREALAIFRTVHGDYHPSVAIASETLGNVVSWQLRFDEAEPILLEALRLHKASQGDNRLRVAACIANLGALRLNQRRYAEAESLFREALVGLEQVLDPDHLFISMSRMSLGGAIGKQGRFEEAEPIILQGFNALVDNPEVPPAKKATARAHLLDFFRGQHEALATEQSASRLAEWQARLEPPPSR